MCKGKVFILLAVLMVNSTASQSHLIGRQLRAQGYYDESKKEIWTEADEATALKKSKTARYLDRPSDVKMFNSMEDTLSFWGIPANAETKIDLAGAKLGAIWAAGSSTEDIDRTGLSHQQCLVCDYFHMPARIGCRHEDEKACKMVTDKLELPFSFMIVQNPFNRLVTECVRKFEKKERPTPSPEDCSQFAKYHLSLASQHMKHGNSPMNENCRFIPQYQYAFFDEAGSSPSVDVALFMENLEINLAELTKALKLEPFDLDHKRSIDDPFYNTTVEWTADDLTEEAKELIRTTYMNDFKLFGYSLEAPITKSNARSKFSFDQQYSNIPWLKFKRKDRGCPGRKKREQKIRRRRIRKGRPANKHKGVQMLKGLTKHQEMEARVPVRNYDKYEVGDKDELGIHDIMNRMRNPEP